MHHLIKRSCLIMMSAVFVATAHADPIETSQKTLIRTAQSGLSVQTQLQKNAYRQEPYQANYNEQVAYQETETYYVDVPYQDQEAYTDYEDYYTNDYICQNYTEYQRQCHNERRCDQNFAASFNLASIAARPGSGGDCQGPVCSDGGGSGGNWGGGGDHNGGGGGGGNWGGGGDHSGGGGPGPSHPDPGPVPHPEPRPPVCHDEQICNDVPVTKQRCDYQQVRHSRPVTKYRTVTKYRQEARSRTVTKYRNEVRCCVTKYNTVFDHQWGLQVQVNFPAGTELQGTGIGAETESFNFALAGTEAAPDVILTPIKTIFGYQVISKQISQGQAVITLQTIPRYKADDLKQSTIQNLRFTATGQGLAYQFSDNAMYPRISSSQQLLIADSGTKEIVAQTEIGEITQRDNKASVGITWDFTHNYEVVLKIHREGTVIEGGVVDFEIRQSLVLQVDLAALKDDNKITAKVVGLQAAAQLSLFDATIPYATVVTDYTITIVRKNSAGATSSIGAKSFSRASLVSAMDGSVGIPLSSIVSAKDLQSYIVPGGRINVVVEVRRQMQNGNKIQFWKDNWIDLK